MMEMKPIVNQSGEHTIDQENYVVSFVRHPTNRHGLLILEGINQEGGRVAHHMDLVVKRGGNNTLDKCIPEKWVGGNSIFSYPGKWFKEALGHSSLPLQKAEVRINEIKDEEQWELLNNIASDFLYQTYPITREQAEKLQDNVKKDQTADNIYYNFSGDGSGHSASYSGSPYHSCISFAKRHLINIDVPLVDKWYNFVIVIPEYEVPQSSNIPRPGGI